MNLGQFLSILKARKWVALLIFSLVVATTVAVSLLLPSQYTGTASVVVDIRPDPVSAMGVPAAALRRPGRRPQAHRLPARPRPGRAGRPKRRPPPTCAPSG